MSATIVLQGVVTTELLAGVKAICGAATVVLVSDRIVRFGDMPALPDAAPRERIASLADAAQVDCAFIATPRPLGDFRLAVMDMDSTLITIECIDEIADMQGIKPAVAAITESAMRGEIDFPQALRRRVGLLKGLPVEALQRVYDERLRPTPGVETMLAAFRSAGLATLVVSGGFTFFTSRLVERLALDDARANVLGVENGVLTGCVVGQIVDGEAKRQALLDTCQRLGARPEQAIAIGDGANDLPMMRAAGISIAYHAKPVVRAQATYAVNHHGLDAVPPLFFK
jgi:phosphoserine phosphatase